MEITPIHVTIANLTKNYKDDGDGGVFDYDDRLTIRPAYQLGLFVQKIKKIKDLPLAAAGPLDILVIQQAKSILFTYRDKKAIPKGIAF